MARTIEEITADVESALTRPMELDEALGFFVNRIYEEIGCLRALQAFQEARATVSRAAEIESTLQTNIESLQDLNAKIVSAEQRLASMDATEAQLLSEAKAKAEAYQAQLEHEILESTQNELTKAKQDLRETKTVLDAERTVLAKEKSSYEEQRKNLDRDIRDRESKLRGIENQLKRMREKLGEAV